MSLFSCRESFEKCVALGGRSTGHKRTQLSQDDLMPGLAKRLIAATNPYELFRVVVGDEAWFVQQFYLTRCLLITYNTCKYYNVRCLIWGKI